MTHCWRVQPHEPDSGFNGLPPVAAILPERPLAHYAAMRLTSSLTLLVWRSLKRNCRPRSSCSNITASVP